MSITPVQTYVGLIVAGAIFAAGVQDWYGFASMPLDVLTGVGFLTLLGLISEGTTVRSTLNRGTSTSSIVFLPSLACVLLFGTTASVLFFVLTGVITEFLLHRKAVMKSVFNASQYVVCAGAAGWVFEFAGGYPEGLEVAALDKPFDPQLFAFAAFGLTFLALNNVLVLAAAALSSSSASDITLRQLAKRRAGSFVHDVLISPLGILFAFLYFQAGNLGLAVSLLPLLFVRHSYLSRHLLERANKDLLRVLVKAIETRDPYTSGHSVRVQLLAERIGKGIGLSERRRAELRTAALLHDVGKIELVYEQILRKPDALSVEERRVIESHVTRGVEILTSLSSFRPDVIDGVRYHHESIDGTGYPAGLRGDDIPLYARIIKISDAIDAMLSDRPYRSALTVAEVHEQLRIFAGVQFDPNIVNVVMRLGLVEAHHFEICCLRESDLECGLEPGVREGGRLASHAAMVTTA